jgi:hypothetical protein
MAKIKIHYSKELHQERSKGVLTLQDFLNQILLQSDEAKRDPAKITDPLLAFHANDGGFPEILDLEIIESHYDSTTNKGQLVFQYILGYSNTCAGTRNDLTKKDRIDFTINEYDLYMELSFLDVDLRSTGEEF